MNPLGCLYFSADQLPARRPEIRSEASSKRVKTTIIIERQPDGDYQEVDKLSKESAWKPGGSMTVLVSVLNSFKLVGQVFKRVLRAFLPIG